MDDYPEHDDKPKKRVGFVRPPKHKLGFHDGSPRPVKRLQTVIYKVIDSKSELYQFDPIRAEDDFRLLKLLPGRGTGPVKCFLVPSILPSNISAVEGRAQAQRYEALSYYWGQGKATMPITITSYGSNGSRPSAFGIQQKKFFIRPNLHAALVELRHEEDFVWLWVDAICIDQENGDEKTAQVSRMNEIYSEAHNICIWLGVGELEPAGTKRTFDFIRDILDLKLLDGLVVDRSSAPGWLAFVGLMRNRWFSRRWVVQELALAKEATVHWGGEIMQWSDFAIAVSLFVTKHDQINQLLKEQNPAVADPIGDMKALGANTLAEATSNLFRRSKDGVILERLMSLEALVSTLLPFEATDPRDIVYAVLSIAKDTPYSNVKAAAVAASPTPEGLAPGGDPRIVPNYDKSLQELCADFIDYCVENSDSLDIICRHWAPVPDVKQTSQTTEAELAMPTWVTSIEGSAFGGPEAALQGRHGGDSLVGVPSRQNRRNYSASGDLKPSIRIQKGKNKSSTLLTPLETADGDNELPRKATQSTKTNEERAVVDADKQPNGFTEKASSEDAIPKPKTEILLAARLYAKGMCLDSIKILSPRAAGGLIMRESLEMGGWIHPVDDDMQVPDVLWRTLVADRGPNNISAPSWYPLACLHCLGHVTPNGDLDTGALKANPGTASTMVTFIKRVQEVVWNRKFLLSKKFGLFGLAPTNAQEGDLICFLFGCSVPVILRKLEDESGTYYHFIGESYIHGMMDGEALETLSQEQPKHPYKDQPEFEIR